MDAIVAFLYVVAVFVVYKILDRIVRIPKLGGLDKRYILVTGCDTGFGHEITKRLDGMGCHVFAACLTEKGESELQKSCSKRLKTLHMNVAKTDSIQKAYEVVKKALPPGKGLWGVLNNAGIAGNIGPAEWLTRADYQQVFDINTLGLIDVTVIFLPLVKRAKGRIVNTASVFGRTSLVGSTPYCISKYGVECFSDAMRRQMRDFNVTVHLIEPGFHKTNIVASAALERGFRNAWSHAPAEVKDDYGEEFLETAIDKSINTFVSGIVSERISDVIDVYEHALLGRYPRARYLVGTDAKLVWIPLNHWMPEWLGDYLLNKLGGSDRPIPRAVKTGKYK